MFPQKLFPCLLVLALLGTTSAFGSDEQHAQHRPRGHSHGGPALFLASLTAQNLVPPKDSTATATAAFVIDRAQQSIRFDLTYHGLEKGPVRSLGLYNSGVGGKGPLVHQLCGEGSEISCPSAPSASFSGNFKSSMLDGKLLGEFASGRIYLELVGSEGTPELRGQLEANGSMAPVRNFMAHLTPRAGVSSSGSGTAVVSEVYFSDGRVGVYYYLTVAQTRGAPRMASMAAGSDQPTDLSNLRALPSAESSNGGSLRGDYQVGAAEGQKDVVSRMLAAGSPKVGVLVKTAGFPEGELYGDLVPIE